MAFVEMTNLDDLRIGLFVKLECSWWNHPFTKNTFKIQSKKEISTIRGIKKLRLLYDPDLSTPVPTEENPESDDVDESLISNQVIEVAGFPPEEIEQSEQPKKEDELVDPEIEQVVKEQRRRAFHEHRQQFKKVEDAYWKILGESKDIFKGVSGGNANGLKQAAVVVSNLDAVLNNPGATMTLMDVVSSHGMSKGISHHAINVCILCMMTGRTLGLSKEELNALALAALFHDIGQRFLPVKVKFEGSGIMTQADPKTLPLHPEQGKQLLDTFIDFPRESIDAVFQHHERLDGSGYPLSLKDEQISLLAKILMVLDEYDDLCNAPNAQASLTPHEALSRLFKANYEKETCKFSIDVILAVIQSLSLFPPGTIVELNDGSIGIVTSINMQAPTKPLILLYVEDTPKHEAVMVNLAEEGTLSIMKSIKPKDLPPNILEHLSPRRMSIFVHVNPAAEHVQVHLKSKV